MGGLLAGGAPMSIVGGVREFARATPAATAVIDGDRTLAFADLDERASRLAQHLLTSGLTRGERVAVLIGNRLEYPEVAAGIAKAGLVMVPLNPRLTPSEAGYILEHSGARTIVLDDALTPVVAESPLPRLAIGGSYDDALAGADATDPCHQGASPSRTRSASPTRPGRPAGPKGVLISHRSRALTFYMSALEWGLGNGRVSAAVAPMYHGAGFAFGYAPVFTGGTVTMLRAWDPEEFLRLVQRDRVQSAFLVPTHAHLLRALGDDVIASYDLSSLDTLYFNAAALPWPLKQWVMATFPDVGVHELYGSTESGIITNLRPSTSTGSRVRSGTAGTSPSSASSTTPASRSRPASRASCSAARRT